MKILTLFASPETTGNTAKVTEWVENNFEASENVLERVNLYEKNIIGHCGSKELSFKDDCDENPEKPCCHDDAIDVIEQMAEADVILFASPLYGWDVSSTMKALWERIFTSQQSKKLRGKKAALIVTAAGPLEKNADLVGEIFNRCAKFAGIENVGELIVTNCTTPEKLDPAIQNRTRMLATKIAASFE